MIFCLGIEISCDGVKVYLRPRRRNGLPNQSLSLGPNFCTSWDVLIEVYII